MHGNNVPIKNEENDQNYNHVDLSNQAKLKYQSIYAIYARFACIVALVRNVNNAFGSGRIKKIHFYTLFRVFFNTFCR